jgi:hypothetical protein
MSHHPSEVLPQAFSANFDVDRFLQQHLLSDSLTAGMACRSIAINFYFAQLDGLFQAPPLMVATEQFAGSASRPAFWCSAASIDRKSTAPAEGPRDAGEHN